MKKSDLKTGMIAEFANRELGIFIHTTFITYNHGGISLDLLDSNFKYVGKGGLVDAKDFNIDKIYQLNTCINYNANIGFWMSSRKFLQYAYVIWERKGAKEMTVEQISRALGFEVKIIR